MPEPVGEVGEAGAEPPRLAQPRADAAARLLGGIDPEDIAGGHTLVEHEDAQDVGDDDYRHDQQPQRRPPRTQLSRQMNPTPPPKDTGQLRRAYAKEHNGTQ